MPSRPKKFGGPKPSPPPGRKTPSAFEKAAYDLRHNPGAFPNVSPRWLAGAAAVAILGALALAWLTLCLLYWQGSWQLLYHPKAAITRTPASVGITYEPVKFAVTETGTPQLTGWWIPANGAKFTVLYLHGADGNLSDTVDTLAALHRQDLNIFAIDYRGYGQSQPAKPSEQHLLQDSEWALTWLTQTRRIQAKTIVVAGYSLGANLAAEFVDNHSDLAGIILDQPQENPMAPVYDDSRSKLVPAHLFITDRYELAAAKNLDVPSLWLITRRHDDPNDKLPAAYQSVGPMSTAVILHGPIQSIPSYEEGLKRWLDDLHPESHFIRQPNR